MPHFSRFPSRFSPRISKGACHTAPALNTVETRTVIFDSLRQGIEGGGEPLATVLFLYIAIEIFQLPSEQKALLASSRAISFCIAPFLPYIFARSRLRRSHLAAYCNLLSGAFLLLAGLSSNGWQYVICSSLFTFFLFVKVPLFSRIYRENYRSLQRGKLFSFGAILRNICNLGFNLLTAFVIDRGHYRWVLAGYAIFILLSAIACFLIPSERFDSPTSMAQKKSRLPQWGFVLRDRLFLYICLAWYFLGFGNLALVPMRVEFILDRGSLSPLQLVLILQILPGLIRSVGTVFGGKLFDRLPLLWFRIGTNFIFMTATILFFQSVSWAGLIAGMITFGLAEIGAWFIWNLWVTHLAPNKESVDTYMGVHAFLNGTRGLLGPFIVYALLDSSWVGSYGIRGLSWLAVGSMFLSTLMFLSMAGNRRVNLRR